MDKSSEACIVPYYLSSKNLAYRLTYSLLQSIIMNFFFILHSSFVVSAAMLRVFGQDIAELPLVATSNGNHGKV